MGKIALVRHGQSEWNKKNLWTGWQDIDLTEKGKEEARKAAEIIQDIDFDLFFTSDLLRAINTLEIIRKALNKGVPPPSVKHHALKERHYGEFTGKDKWEIKEIVGEQKFLKIRRGWNTPIKGGETLKDVFLRVVPYFNENILPHLKSGRNVLLVAHGNTIRALVKHFDGKTDEEIEYVEFETGEVIIYEFDQKGKVKKNEKRR